MPLYLVDMKFDGEPIGIWNDQGQSQYYPGQEAAQKTALSTIQAKGADVPWSEWVDNLASSVNHRSWWGDIDTPELDMGKVLAQARDHQLAVDSQYDVPDRS